MGCCGFGKTAPPFQGGPKEFAEVGRARRARRRKFRFALAKRAQRLLVETQLRLVTYRRYRYGKEFI
jgi:hypothetical protein